MSAASSEIFIEGGADDASERASDVVLIKLLDIHHRSIVLAREPLAALSLFGTGGILSFSVSTLNAEISEVSWVTSIIRM